LNVTRCRIDSASGVYLPASSAVSEVNIGWNAFRGQNTLNRKVHYIFVEVDGNQPTPTSYAHNFAIYRNYFLDKFNSTADDTHNICFGNAKPGPTGIGHLEGAFVEYNLIAAGCQRKHSIYLKRACTLQFNQVDQTSGNFGFRHGYGGKMWGNRISGALVMVNDGRGTGAFQRHDIRGNVCTAGTQIRLQAGAINGDPNATPAEHQAASWVLLVGNTASIEAGHIPDGFVLDGNNGQNPKLHDVTIRDHRGSIDQTTYRANIVAGTITVETSRGGLEVPTTITLGVADVGLETADQAA
jgi:hypothetical protein